MQRTRRSQRSDKREAILSAAEELFTRFGARRVTVEDICHTAGVSKMTFYKHFRNKIDLIRKIHDELVERGFAAFDEINSRDIPFPEKIDAMGRWKQQYMSRLHAGFFDEMLDVQHTMAEYKRRYMTNIANAQQAGEVRADVDAEFVWLFVEKAGELLREGVWKGVCSDLGDAQRQLRTMLWYGLLRRGVPQTPHSESEGGTH